MYWNVRWLRIKKRGLKIKENKKNKVKSKYKKE
jgi:hypothetical protein